MATNGSNGNQGHVRQQSVPAESTGGRQTIVAVIPAYNEARYIGSVVLNARQHAGTVIVVDDGSTDATAKIAAAAGAVVVRQTANQGKGTALKAGFQKAAQFQPDIVITLDADGQHVAGEMLAVAEPIIKGAADVAIALGQKAESINGLRALSRTALDSVVFRANGYSAWTELERIALANGLKTHRVAIPIDEQIGGSKVQNKVGTGDRELTQECREKFAASIVIPAYNEEEALPHVLSTVTNVANQYDYEIIVVDDGSSDRTADVVRMFNCHLVSHLTNRGKGGAMQSGIDYAHGEVIVFIDGDATYPVDAIPEMVSLLQEYDVVRGVRHISHANMPRLNRLGNILFERTIKLLHHVDSSDALTGLYGVRKSALKKMRLQSNGFDIESEIVIKAGAMGLRSTTIPITYHERIGDKKLRPVKDGLRILARVLVLAALYNPFVMYVVPGLILWLVGVGAILSLSRGPIATPFANLSIHSFIVSVMSFLAGFQLFVFGLVANLYAAESGLGIPSRSLSVIAQKIPRLAGAAFSAALIAGGILWTAALGIEWWRSGFGPFVKTETLVVSLALVIWGIQLLCTMFFLSLFAGVSKLHPEPRTER